MTTLRYQFPAPAMPVELPPLPPAISDAPSVVALSMPKAGSTLLYGILRSLAPAAGLVYVEPDAFFFNLGVPPAERPPEAARLFRPAGYCYGGFRGRPRFDIPIMDRAQAVFLVRDPRDMLVSHYYSISRSHRIPETSGSPRGVHYLQQKRLHAQRRSLADHVRATAANYARNFDSYLAGSVIRRDNVAVYRYEDVIFRKREWVAEMCRWFGWDIPEDIRNAAADQADIVPDRADPDAHIRQVHPGSHARELPPETVDHLNRMLGRYLRLFGYL